MRGDNLLHSRRYRYFLVGFRLPTLPVSIHVRESRDNKVTAIAFVGETLGPDSRIFYLLTVCIIVSLILLTCRACTSLMYPLAQTPKGLYVLKILLMLSALSSRKLCHFMSYCRERKSGNR